MKLKGISRDGKQLNGDGQIDHYIGAHRHIIRVEGDKNYKWGVGD